MSIVGQKLEDWNMKSIPLVFIGFQGESGDIVYIIRELRPNGIWH